MVKFLKPDPRKIQDINYDALVKYLPTRINKKFIQNGEDFYNHFEKYFFWDLIKEYPWP